jgi:hypothetical protein
MAPGPPVIDPQSGKPINAWSSGNPALDNLLAGGYEGINSAAMGLPDLIAKAGNGDAYRQLRALRNANPTGTTVGGALGDIGDMFIPGGEIAKGLGAGAKAIGATKLASGLGKVGDIASGASGAGKFAQGAAQAGEQAIPRMAIQDVQNPQDIGANAAGAGASMLAGGGVNSAIGKASEALKGIKQGFGHQMTDQFLSGIGVQGSDIAQHLASQGGGEGHIASQLEPAKLDLAQYAHSNGIKDDDTLKTYLAKSQQDLAPVAQQWDSAPPSPQVINARFAADPANADLIKSGKVGQPVMDIISKSLTDPSDPSKMGAYWDVNKTLNNLYHDASRVYKSASPQSIQDIQEARNTLQTVDGYRKAVKDQAFSMAPDAANDLRKNWANHQLLQDASINNSTQMQGAVSGSNSGGMSGISNPAIGRAVVGGLAGGYGGYQADPNHIGGSVAGTALGAMAPNMLPKAINSLMTRTAGRMLPKGAGEAFTGNVAPDQAKSMLSQIMGKPSIPAGVGAIPTSLGSQPPNTPPPQGPQIPVGPTPHDQSLAQNVGLKTSGSTAPISMGGQPIEVPGESKVDINGVAGQRITSNMERMYDYYRPTENGQPMSRQDFFNYAYQQSGHFDPQNEITLNVLANSPEDKDLIRNYASKIQTLRDINWDSLTKPGTANILDPGGQNDRDQFVNLVANLNNPDPSKEATPAAISAVNTRVDRIRNNLTLSDAQKRNELVRFMIENRFPVSYLDSMGLLKGTPLEGKNGY